MVVPRCQPEHHGARDGGERFSRILIGVIQHAGYGWEVAPGYSDRVVRAEDRPGIAVGIRIRENLFIERRGSQVKLFPGVG